MVVSDIDLRLLRVFRAVVESGGFSNAQAILNVGPSTISTQMSQLETRLGFSLCQRGRSGFRLTPEGEALYRHVVALFQSVQGFQAQAAELKGGLAGTLTIGFIDNLITDLDCPLQEALKSFVEQPRNSVQVILEVLSPAEIEKGLLDQSLDAGVGIFLHQLPGLTYTPLYRERDVLLCHRNHPLAAVDDPKMLARAIRSARKVMRGFMGVEEFPFQEDTGSVAAKVTSLEAAAMMILTGSYIGFLPKHYARPWLDSGELVALLPNKFMHYSELFLVTRMQRTPASSALEAFLQCMQAQQFPGCTDIVHEG